MCVHFHGSEAVERKTEEKEKLYRTTMKFSVPRDVNGETSKHRVSSKIPANKTKRIVGDNAVRNVRTALEQLN